MDDFKKLACELFDVVMEEHTLLAVAAITGSDDMVKHFMDKSKDVSGFLIEHGDEFHRARFEVEANEELNSEV